MAVDIDTLDREALEQTSQHVVEAEKQCRITLSADAQRSIPLGWHGGRGHKYTEIALHPGKSVVQPLSKAQAWFGPFSVPYEYALTNDETRKEALRAFWNAEKARYLQRYDYPRVSHRDMRPAGPHRSPDVTVTILEADGSESEPIRLHELYKIGEFDPIKDTFAQEESVEAVRNQYETTIAQMREDALRRDAQIAEMAGMMKGLLAGQAAKAS